MTPDITTFQNIGVAGLSVWVIYLMYKATLQRLKEKDSEILSEIDKRDKRNSEQQQTFTDYTMKVHESTTKQLSENTKALSANSIALAENTKVMLKVSEHINTPVINQIKVEKQT